MDHREPAIATDRLTKRFGAVPALIDLSLSVPRGALYGFLGPNGAGKTTAIRLLLGFIRATSGSSQLNGHDSWRDGVRARHDLGFLVQPDALYPDMTGRAHLDHAVRLSGRQPTLQAHLLDALELPRSAVERRLGTYSKGMRQKLALVLAMQHDPGLLILDEPSDGLDPLMQRRFETLLRERHAAGRTIFMSSHDLTEVDRLCERVAIVRGGRLVAEETVAALKGRQRRRLTAPVAARTALERLPGISPLGVDGDTATYLVDAPLDPVLRALADLQVADVTIGPPSLDDIFLAFYERKAEG
jgi:ABC-2 type transport system ATP-binding protein